MPSLATTVAAIGMCVSVCPPPRDPAGLAIPRPVGQAPRPPLSCRAHERVVLVACSCFRSSVLVARFWERCTPLRLG